MRTLIAASIATLFAAEAAAAFVVEGRATSAGGAPVVGALVTLRRGDPIQLTPVFNDAEGRFRSPELPATGALSLRVRRIGWKDLVTPLEAPAKPLVEPGAGLAPLVLVLEPETDPAALAAQLPANRWLALLLEKFESETQREEFVRQCTYCHQQGNAATRLERDWQWEKVLALMARIRLRCGRVWTSNSNLPTWQVEGGFPRVLRLDPGEAERVAAGAR